jgi:aminoglycoside phosphotransferase (APT) family kinase protein
MPFLFFGEFVGRELVISPFDSGSGGGLTGWFDQHADDMGLTRDQVASMHAVIDRAEDLAATGVDRICLAHSDFNPKNLLVDPSSAEITGLIDWEFAHAGSPYTDLGNLLRFCDDPALGEAVLSVVQGAGALFGDQVVERGRAADLWALIDLASRPTANPVAAAAHALITRIADTGDLSGGRIWPVVVH